MFFPATPFRFYPLDLGLAVGLSGAIFVLLTTAVAMATRSSGMLFFKDIFPGFDLNFPGIILGLVWAFGAGFVLGGLAGFWYNWRLRQYIHRHAHVHE
jgi:NhaP-type Na+/H+ and K+/H+ antiporter